MVAIGGSPVGSLWLRTLGTTAAQLLPGTAGAEAPFWSPDGPAVLNWQALLR